MSLHDRNPGPLSAVRTAPSAVHAAPQPASGREFAFSLEDFERIRKLIHDHVGIALTPAKQDMVYSRLTRRLRICGETTFAGYLARLERDRVEWEAFVNSLTTNLTSFFRESHHFDLLTEQLRKIGSGRRIQIWCCAASTGEEPYSIAIAACEAFRSLAPPVSIIASDVNTDVLDVARRGHYEPDRVARMSPTRLQQYFQQEAGGAWRIRPELQRLVSFRTINLLAPHWGLRGPLDAIFCRNVMIYFDKPTQYAILKRFAPLLAPDGALYAGHSESFQHASDLFRLVGRTVYRPVG
ncbi:CheR family methyltransferase [Pseudazoarcus pumilus]|uniref:Chemotaxis protein methyltransferase n=1 Tax=Pseudazoarcus pumilus TaxID=2067960 RepID=A0A2I6S567_9RHOO|nr:CheR family methyltransferase [Pseudazoarcus pumilus]AUN94394.1 chemotaxis protein CheR [Pseudazoarcus pumilus]